MKDAAQPFCPVFDVGQAVAAAQLGSFQFKAVAVIGDGQADIATGHSQGYGDIVCVALGVLLDIGERFLNYVPDIDEIPPWQQSWVKIQIQIHYYRYGGAVFQVTQQGSQSFFQASAL